MDDVQSRWSNMVWKRFQTYFSVRAIHLNSMFSNFCHVLKSDIIKCYYRVVHNTFQQWKDDIDDVRKGYYR